MTDPEEGVGRIYIIFESGPIPENQLPDIRERLGRIGLGRFAFRGALMAEQGEFFSFIDGKEEIVEEPWLTRDEFVNIYLFNYLPKHPSDRPAAWPTTFFGEIASWLPPETVQRNKKGAARAIDRQALRDLGRQFLNNKLIVGGKKRKALFNELVRHLSRPTET